MTTTFRKFCILGVSLAVLTTAGCAKRPRVVVSIETELAASASVTVHLVGVPWVDHHVWASRSVDDYWRPEDSLRRAAMERGMIHEMKFGPGYPLQQALERNDPTWNKWEEMEATYLFVIAHIPDVRGNRKLEFDRAKLRAKEVQIHVSRKGLEQVK